MEKSIKEKVAEKLDFASDMNKKNIDIKIADVKKIDGRIKADFVIDGLPRKKNDNYDSTYRRFPKIFDNFQQFSNYSKTFFEMSDEQLIKLSEAKT